MRTSLSFGWKVPLFQLYADNAQRAKGASSSVPLSRSQITVLGTRRETIALASGTPHNHAQGMIFTEEQTSDFCARGDYDDSISDPDRYFPGSHHIVFFMDGVRMENV
jgi:hypothetical protein